MSLISFELHENKCRGSHTEVLKKVLLYASNLNKTRHRRLPSKYLNPFTFHENQRRFRNALFRV